MQFLFRDCKIIDPNSAYHLKRFDIRVEHDKITEIGENLALLDAKEISAKDLSVAHAFTDLEAEAGDPGLEHREDLESLSQAAVAGGYARIGLRPHTLPVVHDKSGVSYLKQQSKILPIDIWPIGALSHSTEGKDITEMLDMAETGALAFSDGIHSVQHAGLMLRALLYAKTFDGLIMNQPLDKSIAAKGQLHEGVISTTLGMTGIPALSEVLMLERDLRLLEYTDSRMHISHLSTAAGVELVRAAKAKGLKVTASVAALNLLYTDEVMTDFDSHYKVMPPLRLESDRQALITGLKDGTIDCISSNHCPRELEAKALEYLYADFGAAMLSTAFAAAKTAVGDALTEEELIALFTSKPNAILKQALAPIAEGAQASLVFYQYNETWTPAVSDIKSKSKNAPLIGTPLAAKVLGVYNKGQLLGF